VVVIEAVAVATTGFSGFFCPLFNSFPDADDDCDFDDESTAFLLPIHRPIFFGRLEGTSGISQCNVKSHARK
jgi:hypothetical protein